MVSTMVLLSLAGLFVVFNLTFIYCPLHGRFLWYVPLAIVPVLFFAAKDRPVLIGLLMVCTLGVSGWRAVKAVHFGAVPALTGAPDPTCFHMRSEYYLTSNPNGIPPKGMTAVIPPTFNWIKRMDPLPVKREGWLLISKHYDGEK